MATVTSSTSAAATAALATTTSGTKTTTSVDWDALIEGAGCHQDGSRDHDPDQYHRE